MTGLVTPGRPSLQDHLQDEVRRVIDLIPGLVWSALPDGRFDFFNRRWCEYTGLGSEEAYRREPGSPTPLLRCLIDQLTHVASIAIERTRIEDALGKALTAAGAHAAAAPEERAELAALCARRASLGRREREVMDLVVAGLLNKQIAAHLGISEATVKAHRGKVMRKMQAGSLAQLVRMAARLDRPTAGT